MLRYDPATFIVYASEPLRRPAPPKRQPLGRLLCGFAAAGLVARAAELLLARRSAQPR